MLIGANLITNDTTLSILDVAPVVEAAGLESIFQGEHSHIPIDTRYPGNADGDVPDFYKRFPDLFVTMAAAAALTTTLRLGAGVVLVAEHQTLRLAKAVASLDVLSGGRVLFGVGYGWNKPEWTNNGVDPARPRTAFREKLAVLSRLWADDVVEYHGDTVSFTASWSYPKPAHTTARRPGPPILLGANSSDAAFNDVLELCDGWYPLAGPTLLDDVARLRARGAERGVKPSVSVCEMAGQMTGASWYCDDTDARSRLFEPARTYAAGGVDRLVIGVPVDSRSHLEAAVGVLAELQTDVGSSAASSGAAPATGATHH